MSNTGLQEGRIDLDAQAFPADWALVRDELRRILASRHFQTSRRGKEFLQYVVDQKKDGNGDLLKERSIGVQIFGRKPDYSTGEDPVVRVQAGDVRRRLERYYADPEIKSEIVIEIPLGSYAPVFSRRNAQAPTVSAQAETSSGTDPGIAPSIHLDSEYREPVAGTPQSIKKERTAKEWMTNDSSLAVASAAEGRQSEIQLETDLIAAPKRAFWSVGILASFVLLLLISVTLTAFFVSWYIRRVPESPMTAFWSPASKSGKPVLLCLPKPMVYRPSPELFEKYAKSHPDSLLTREARQDRFLPLDPTEPIKWGDMLPVLTSGPGIGGVVAAINISSLLTEQGIRFELRFGEEATYADMRGSPVVLIGAINTDWAAQLTSESAFAFDEAVGSPNIHETGGAKRVWTMEKTGPHVIRDYGLITRQLYGRAGQFLVQVAGISHFGTEAASEMLMEQQELANALRSRGIDLHQKNLQIVVSTDVTNERSGPPHVVAISSW